ncbi:MAG: hypothetical protein KF871_01215 [Hydrogenophaga sp.]|uniref:hypothetical protein n=1 Tax=Hydrogenophaga sp. TaxID=1904254 RepID=UPI001DA8B85C|nr:hypothetical protein [Hydrogenophaga sp.]MBX3608488.1 hypothetical protein [Hydrogenophaga sp.]
MDELPLTRRHHQRLRDTLRSSGWPCHDPIEVDLLAAALLERVFDAEGREQLRVTDAGIAVLARAQRSHRTRRDAHEALVARVAQAQLQQGRLAWCGLSLRAPLVQADGANHWVLANPDVFSIRRSSRPDWLEPVVHEIKVSRADLLADLRQEAKRAAYLAMSGALWYVLGRDARGRAIGGADDVPAECGVMLDTAEGWQVARDAPRRAVPALPHHVWLALAQAAPVVGDDPVQALL